MRAGSDPVRLDPVRLAGWLGDRVPDLDPPLTIATIEGGLSNLTFLVTDAAGRRWVLRRPPWHGILPSAHDVLRESRVMAALAATGVPVPPVVGAEPDPAVLGEAPFFVMDYVDGLVLRDAAQATALAPVHREQLGRHAISVLATLHSLDPDAVGLGDLGRRDGYVQRQLRRWWRQWQDSRTRDQPLVERLHHRLSAAVPPQRRTSIVHGDYRLDNLIVDRHGTVRAVLDWELCTLGDPLADLGSTLAYWIEPGEAPYQRLTPLTTSPGFPSRTALLSHYAELTGEPIPDAGYYTALGRWKIAIILEGVYARYATGAMAGSTDHVAGLLDDADRFLERALDDIDRTSR
jgi:aminoglycoside phosphotransferase (APT) family kinase protein